MYCSNCGNQVNNSRFCPNCGNPLGARPSGVPGTAPGVPVYIVPEEKKNKKAAVLIAVFAGIAVLLAAVTAVLIITRDRTSTSSSPVVVGRVDSVTAAQTKEEPVIKPEDILPDDFADEPSRAAAPSQSVTPSVNTGTQPTQKTTVKAEEPVWTEAPAPAETPIDEVLRAFPGDYKNRLAQWGYDGSLSGFYYAVTDINYDGTDDLVISVNGSSPAALYTFRGSTPVNLFFVERHGQYAIHDDGSVVHSYKSYDVYSISTSGLIPVFSTKNVFEFEGDDIYAALKEEYQSLREEYGVSDAEMYFNYTYYPVG